MKSNRSLRALQRKIVAIHGITSGDFLKEINTILWEGYLPEDIHNILITELITDQIKTKEREPHGTNPHLLAPDTRPLINSKRPLFPSTPEKKSETDPYRVARAAFERREHHISELMALREIVRICTNTAQEKEASLREQAHERMLNVALLECPGLDLEILAGTNIANESRPPRSDNRDDSPSSTRLIDYAMVLMPRDYFNPGNIDESMYNNRRLTCSRIGRLSGCLASSYDPLNDRPSGIFITSRQAADVAEWLCKWFSQYSDLPRSDISLPPFPIIQIGATSWDLWFAFKTARIYEVYGPFCIGSTNDLVGAYRLLGALRTLANWMALHFYIWVDRYIESVLKSKGTKVDSTRTVATS
ncbi:hypothetical protein RRF57_003170 [Xylaria bambusicola]|uniref:PD-(D/E)XK nuclease-like domain-containing protein n=1 Tax=Xylaria bambusicola TaxID=326684 RepID=A0AAN7YW73_9PEZI